MALRNNICKLPILWKIRRRIDLIDVGNLDDFLTQVWSNFLAILDWRTLGNYFISQICLWLASMFFRWLINSDAISCLHTTAHTLHLKGNMSCRLIYYLVFCDNSTVALHFLSVILENIWHHMNPFLYQSGILSEDMSHPDVFVSGMFPVILIWCLTDLPGC